MIPGLSTAKLIGLAVLLLFIAGLGVTIKLQSGHIDTLKAQVVAAETERDQAVGVANDNAAKLREITADRDIARAAATQAQDAFQKHKAAAYIQIARLKKEVADATAQNECPVAPSVLAALRGLSGAGQPADGDASQDGKAPGPGSAH